MANCAILAPLLLLVCNNTHAAPSACHPLLWPSTSTVRDTSRSVSVDVMRDLQQYSKKLLSQSPHPLAVLGSAGKINTQNSVLIASRMAFKDADRASVLAITYRLTHNVSFFTTTREILMQWSQLNRPTGNPIDETRLEGMIWAYDLIACELSETDKAQILTWFEQLRVMKRAWKFGPITNTNNHRIHQLKMLLLLDTLLGRHKDWQDDIISAEKYAMINLRDSSGASVDYFERSALYYHNYVMQPWLEISLITGCCRQPVIRGFSFLSHHILSNQVGNEFSHSQAKIDALRAQGGFLYTKKGGTFDVTNAAPTIVLHYTLVQEVPEPALWAMLQQAKPTPRLVFLKTRRLLWQR